MFPWFLYSVLNCLAVSEDQCITLCRYNIQAYSYPEWQHIGTILMDFFNTKRWKKVTYILAYTINYEADHLYKD